MTDIKQRKLLERAIPFLRDGAFDYEDDGTNGPLELIRDIEAALQETQPVASDPTWVNKKPTHAGVYGVRGFNIGRPPTEQFEAIVVVWLYEDELFCNLHESASEDDLDNWTPLSDFSDKLDWCKFVPANTPPQPQVEQNMIYADADALIAHLDTLMDDDGQGGEKWEPAQAAIAGIRAWLGGLSSHVQPQGVPEGYVLVPKVPTKAMRIAFVNMWSFGFANEDMANGCWGAMLDAAPSPGGQS